MPSTKKEASGMSEIELFKDLKKVEIEDLGILKEYFELANYQESNHNLINLYMWKHVYPVWYYVGNGWLVIVGKHNGEYFLYMPLCSHGCFFEAVHVGEEVFEKNNLKYILSCFTQAAKEDIISSDERFEAEALRDGFDYIYEFDKLSTFSGKKLQKKRNHINAFLNEYQNRYSYARMQSEDVFECLEFLDNWEKENEDAFLADECNGVRFLLEHFPDFDYVGGIIRIDGKIEAMCIGSRLNQDTVQINVEKANKDIRGLYPIITREYLSHEWSNQNIKWVNREDDLGLEHLRQAKLSLYPAYLLEKYKIYKKG